MSKHDDLARRLIYGAEVNGGATEWHGETKTTGYLCGIPGHGMKSRNADNATVKELAAWAAMHEHAGHAIGSWQDEATNILYFDVSDWHETLADALDAARERGELAVWDIANGAEVRA